MSHFSRLLLVFFAYGHADTADLGKIVAEFTLKDTNGKPVVLAQFKDKKAVAVVFLGTQCPINNLFL